MSQDTITISKHLIGILFERGDKVDYFGVRLPRFEIAVLSFMPWVTSDKFTLRASVYVPVKYI
jgi:hypothetical protein